MKNSLWVMICLGFLAAACNEEVSPDLNKSNATGSDATVIPPSQYVFKVENTSPAMLGYNLHRSGAGRSFTDCTISSSTPFTGPDYAAEGIPTRDHDSKLYDYSCILEAEELNLYFSGLSFKVSASQNTCEYVGYSPFSYWAYQPGNSSKSVIGKISSDPNADCSLPAVPLAVGSLTCGTDKPFMADTVVPAGTRQAFTEDTACAFDYSASGGPNCDNGVINITEYTYSYNSDTLATTSTGSIRKKYCGGDPINCIAGPIKKIEGLSKVANGTELYRTVKNQSFEQEHSFDGGIKEQRGNNLWLANWRRDLAAFDIDFVDSTVDYNIGADVFTLGAFFNNGAFAGKKNYNPRVLELYSVGRDGTGAVNSDLTTALAAATISRGFRAQPLASDPFLGYGVRNRTNPHYTFFCLDQSFEVKARIRLSIRDWDRIFYPDPTKTLDKFALISDIDQPDTIARIDNPTGIESQIDYNAYNQFNDLADWDDWIPMERNDATYRWNPKNGFFSEFNFPGE